MTEFMSKTDKTKPWRVRVAEHRWDEVHDHRNGVCDLPASPYEQYPIQHSQQPCYYRDWNLSYKGNCCWGCGCPMCNDQEGRRRENRKERHQAKRKLKKGDWE